MKQFKADFYTLTESELQKIGLRERLFKIRPDTHPSNYHQTINLDRREPSSSIYLEKDTLDLNPTLIDDYLANNTFAIDITSLDDELIARYLLVYKKDLGIHDWQHSTYKISEHISFFMSNPSDKVKLYTIDDFIEK